MNDLKFAMRQLLKNPGFTAMDVVMRNAEAVALNQQAADTEQKENNQDDHRIRHQRRSQIDQP